MSEKRKRIERLEAKITPSASAWEQEAEARREAIEREMQKPESVFEVLRVAEECGILDKMIPDADTLALARKVLEGEA